MKLKEKLAKIILVQLENQGFYINWDKVEKCEKIADEFAVEFAEWIRKEVYYEHLTKEFIYKRNVYESEKELLEIYKKEKEL